MKADRWYALTYPGAPEHARRNLGRVMDIRYPWPGTGRFAIRIGGVFDGYPAVPPPAGCFARTGYAGKLRVGGDTGEQHRFVYGLKLRWYRFSWLGNCAEPEAVLLADDGIHGGQYRIRGGQPMPPWDGHREGDLTDRFGQGDFEEN